MELEAQAQEAQAAEGRPHRWRVTQGGLLPQAPVPAGLRQRPLPDQAWSDQALPQRLPLATQPHYRAPEERASSGAVLH